MLTLPIHPVLMRKKGDSDWSNLYQIISLLSDYRLKQKNIPLVAVFFSLSTHYNIQIMEQYCRKAPNMKPLWMNSRLNG